MTEDAAQRGPLSAGDWYAVVGEQRHAAPPGRRCARVAGLWELADGGADFDEVLDGLLADGLRTSRASSSSGTATAPGCWSAAGRPSRSPPPTATSRCRAPGRPCGPTAPLDGVTGPARVLEGAATEPDLALALTRASPGRSAVIRRLRVGGRCGRHLTRPGGARLARRGARRGGRHRPRHPGRPRGPSRAPAGRARRGAGADPRPSARARRGRRTHRVGRAAGPTRGSR